MKLRSDELEESLKAVDLFPTLEEVVESGGLDRKHLTVGLKLQGEQMDLSTREDVLITDGTKGTIWNVPSLRGLFRGDNVPPPMPNEPPPAYFPQFMFIELHIVTFCDAFGDKTDGEFEDVFSNLRRRPDGKNQSNLHFFLWQVAAGLLGKRIVSAAEYDAIFGRLTRSARAFGIGIVSRNYINVLRQMLPR